MRSWIKIPNREYRAAEGISSTDLKHMAKSPAHFRYWKDHPEENDTPALLMGRAIHKYALEEEDFFSEFAVAPDCDRRTKAGKEAYVVFEASCEGKDIITSDDFLKIQEMRKTLYATPFVEQLLSGQKELSFFMEDEKTGVAIKCRPDCLTQIGDTHILLDYKSTADASGDAFMKSAISLMYDLQLSFYKHILDKITGYEHSVIFIAQEKTPPYAVNILEADKYFLASGADMWRTYLDLYTECEQTGNWFGYINGEVNSLGLPGWLQKQYEHIGNEVE